MHKSKKTLLWIGLVFSVGVLLWSASSLISQDELYVNDLVEYWAAGKLNLSGQNPYDPDALLAIQKEAGWLYDWPDMMWNPPWTLVLIFPLCSIPYHLSWIISLIVWIAIIALSSSWLWQVYGGPPEKLWLAWLLAFTFAPVFISIGLGQITPFMLLGLSGFLYFERMGRDMWAGLSLFFTTIKPHTFFIFWIVLFIWAYEHRRWRILLSTLCAGLIATAIPLFYNPDVIIQYIEALRMNPPTHWVTSSLGTVLRFIFGWDVFWLQFVPPVLGSIWGIVYYFKRRESWMWKTDVPLLLFVASMTIAYGWIMDWVILLVPLEQAAVWILGRSWNLQSKRVVGVYVLANLAITIQSGWGLADFWQIWLPPVILAIYLWVAPLFRDQPGAFNTLPRKAPEIG